MLPVVLLGFPLCCMVWTWDSVFYGASDFVYNAKVIRRPIGEAAILMSRPIGQSTPIVLGLPAAWWWTSDTVLLSVADDTFLQYLRALLLAVGFSSSTDPNCRVPHDPFLLLVALAGDRLLVLDRRLAHAGLAALRVSRPLLLITHLTLCHQR